MSGQFLVKNMLAGSYRFFLMSSMHGDIDRAYERAPIRKWRWNPDAKLVPRRDGKCLLVNYSNSFSTLVDKAVGGAIMEFSGLSIPFELESSFDPRIADMLQSHSFIIIDDRFAAYQRFVRERLMYRLHRSHGLIIMPTEKCNFRCTYCYETFEKGRMSPENQEAVRKAIVRIGSEAPAFSLGFFGGEPLLCADLVSEFSGLAFETMYNRGLPYSASISTNGMLLDSEMFSKLLDVGVVSYQISIDGRRELHDSQRVTAAGKPTFEKILDNLRMMAATDAQFTCILRCNSPRSKFSEVWELFDGSDMQFMRSDVRFVVDLHEIWESDRRDVRPGSGNDDCIGALTKAIDFNLFNKMLQESGFASTSYSMLPDTLGAGCYAGKPNWFVVGPDLTLYKCTVVFDNEKNRVGHIDGEGHLHIDEKKNLLWSGSNALTDGGCSGCHYRLPCGGIACPLTRFTSGAKACPTIRNPAQLVEWANSYPLSAAESSAA